MNDMYVLGFDPVFLDIIVSPLDEFNKKIQNFPKIGEHVTNTDIRLIPGGNCLNVAHVLSKITEKVFFFGSLNRFFFELIQKNIPALHCIETTTNEPNITVALQLRSGEIQMNSISNFFGVSDLSIRSLFYLAFSRVVPFSNMGLNKDYLHLFEFLVEFFQYISNTKTNLIFNNEMEFIYDCIINSRYSFNNLQDLKLKTELLKSNDILSQNVALSEKIFYFDPSTVKSFTNWVWLNSFFITKFGTLPGYKIISLNEDEFEGMTKNFIQFDDYVKFDSHNFLVIHETTKITIITDSIQNKTILQVPPLEQEKIMTSVGAGDAFNAGLLLEMSRSLDIIKACKNGVMVAQQYITNSLP